MIGIVDQTTDSDSLRLSRSDKMIVAGFQLNPIVNQFRLFFVLYDEVMDIWKYGLFHAGIIILMPQYPHCATRDLIQEEEGGTNYRVHGFVVRKGRGLCILAEILG